MMQTHQKVTCTASLLLFWFSLQFFLNNSLRLPSLSKKAAGDTKNRLISLVHTTGTIFLTGTVLITEPNIQNNSQVFLFKFMVCYSLSYFIYDIVAMYRLGLLEIAMLLHHIVCIISEVDGLVGTCGVYEGLICLCFSEVSNILLHWRSIMLNFGLKYTRAFDLVEDCFIYVYVLLRGIIVPVFGIYPSIFQPKTSLILKTTYVLLGVQSIAYIYVIYTSLMRKVKKRKEMDEKGIEYGWWQTDEEILNKLSYYKQTKKE